MRPTLPNVELVLSRPFLHWIVRLSPTNIPELHRLSGPLRREWARHSRQVLKLIPLVCGGGWREQNIRVYLVPKTAPFPSISDPLLLKLRGDVDVTLFTLVHELVHRFLQYSPRFRGRLTRVKREKREAIVNLVAQRVCKRAIGPRKTAKAFEKFVSLVTSVNKDKVGDLMMVLQKKWDQANTLGEVLELLLRERH